MIRAGNQQRALVWLLALMIISIMSACSGARGNPSSSAAGSLTVYNGQEEAITAALVEAFQKKTGITVHVRNGEGTELANQIMAEGSRSPADVMLTENSPEITVLADRGVLVHVENATLARVPGRYRSPAGSWVGFAARESVLVYDPRQVSESQLPRSVLDLANPVWKGRIGIAAAGADFQPIVTAVRILRGEDKAKEWLAGLHTNAMILRNNDAIIEAVNSGRMAAGIINQHYWYRLRATQGEGAVTAKLHHFRNQDPGTLINVSGAAVVGSGKNQTGAQQFLAFLVDREAQQLIVTTKDFEYPIAAGVSPDPQLEPIESLNPAPVDVGQLGNGQATIELMQTVGLL